MPTLVLLPGLHGTACLFGALRAVIPAGFSVRTVEYPTDRNCSYAPLSRMVEEQLRGVGEMVLIAESFSGGLALRFAAEHAGGAGRVKGVVLCVSFVMPPVPRVLCYVATPVIWMRVPVFGVAVRVFLSGFRAEGEVVRELKRAVGLVRPRVLAHRVRVAAWIDAREDLRKCRAPILCLAAGKDRLVGARSVRRILRIRPEVVVKVIDGPHLLLQVKAAEAWGEIEAFLKAVG